MNAIITVSVTCAAIMLGVAALVGLAVGFMLGDDYRRFKNAMRGEDRE